MSRIRSRNTKPEMLVRRYLFSKGFRYRVNVKTLPGTPDVVLGKYRTVIFINGCFWHGHEGCKYFVMPKSNVHFWQTKISRNKRRDVLQREQLSRLGWHTIVIWECQLMPKVRRQTLCELENLLYRIFLDKLKVPDRRPYTQANTESVLKVAEQQEGYGTRIYAQVNSED